MPQSFDTPRLLRHISNPGMINEFRVIVGFADTFVVLFLKNLSDRKGAGKFKLKH